MIAGALLLLLVEPRAGQGAFPPAEFPGAVVLVQGADLAWREAERARRELQRHQRITECQNRVLSQQSRYASSADFLRARQACAGMR